MTLEIDKSSLADAEEWLGIDNIEPLGDKLVANISLPDDDSLVNKILSYGGNVRVAEPSALRERVKAAASGYTKRIKHKQKRCGVLQKNSAPPILFLKLYQGNSSPPKIWICR